MQLGRARRPEPVLSVDFSEGDSGCIVEDVELQDDKGKLKYLRILGVRNTGRTTALDVQVIVYNFTVVESKQTTYRGEVMDFDWAEGVGIKKRTSLQIREDLPTFVTAPDSDNLIHRGFFSRLQERASKICAKEKSGYPDEFGTVFVTC